MKITLLLQNYSQHDKQQRNHNDHMQHVQFLGHPVNAYTHIDPFHEALRRLHDLLLDRNQQYCRVGNGKCYEFYDILLILASTYP